MTPQACTASPAAEERLLKFCLVHRPYCACDQMPTIWTLGINVS